MNSKSDEQIPGLSSLAGAVTASAGVAGAVAGAAAGLIAGPVGAVVGGVIGAVTGAVAGATLEEEDVAKNREQDRLDEEIGVIGGDLGAAVPGADAPFSRRAPSAGAAGAIGANMDGTSRGD